MRCTLRGPLKRQGQHLICLCSSQDIDSQLLALFPGVVLLINCKNDGIKFMFVLSLQQTSGPRSQLGYSYFVHRSVVEDVNDRTKHRTLWNILLQWGEDEETSLTLTDCFFFHPGTRKTKQVHRMETQNWTKGWSMRMFWSIVSKTELLSRILDNKIAVVN
jgi:hypothetical protein